MDLGLVGVVILEREAVVFKAPSDPVVHTIEETLAHVRAGFWVVQLELGLGGLPDVC